MLGESCYIGMVVLRSVGLRGGGRTGRLRGGIVAVRYMDGEWLSRSGGLRTGSRSGGMLMRIRILSNDYGCPLLYLPYVYGYHCAYASMVMICVSCQMLMIATWLNYPMFGVAIKVMMPWL